MAQFWIGQFDFIGLSRPASRPQRRLVREKRPGADGVSFWNVGQTAEPFVLSSVRDIDSALAGDTLLAAYQAVVGWAQPLGWCGENRGLVMVLGVEPLDGGIHQTLLGLGGVLGTSYGVVRCQWTLEWVEAAEQQ